MTSIRQQGTLLRRAPLLAPGFLCLLLGIAGGLVRIGWSDVPALAASVALHGPLMVAGFLGTVIGLERAVALGRSWGYAAPALTGVGALVALAAPRAGATLITAGAAIGAAGLGIALRRTRARWIAAQAAGAACFVIGSAFWALGWPLYQVVAWWQAFLVLVIAGERLELSRLREPGAGALLAFAALAALAVGGAARASAGAEDGVRWMGAAWLGLSAWLLHWDLARRSLGRAGLPRFMAASVLAGHGWLGASGALALSLGSSGAGASYEAALHALLVGFVFSMVFGHAPVIFPAVLGVPMRFSRRFWIHLALLHAGVVLRVAGDLGGPVQLRASGGLLNALAILLFLVQTAASAVAGSRQAPVSTMLRP
jgi:hypothetical protein